VATPGRSGWTGSSVEARNGKGGSQSSTLTKFIDWCNGRSARQMDDRCWRKAAVDSIQRRISLAFVCWKHPRLVHVVPPPLTRRHALYTEMVHQ
jgi:hypothetical protein